MQFADEHINTNKISKSFRRFGEICVFISFCFLAQSSSKIYCSSIRDQSWTSGTEKSCARSIRLRVHC